MKFYITLIINNRKRSLTQNGRLTYSCCANKCKRLIYKYNIKKESSVINSRNSKCFFNYVNKKLHSCYTSGPLINTDGTKCIDDTKKSNILNDFFVSVFTNDNGNMPTLLKETVNTSGHIMFTPFAVSRAIQKIKSVVLLNLMDFLHCLEKSSSWCCFPSINNF